MDHDLKVYPNEQRTIRMILEDKASLNGDRTFLYYEDRIITYRQLNDHSNIAANAFLDLGLKRGDKVALVMETVCGAFSDQIA